jgi:hypothetical protein
MRRTAVVLAAITALAGGCGTGGHSFARNVLIGVAVISAGAAVGAAVVSDNKKTSLANDAEAGGLSGRQFADRDREGTHWNRAARASAFACGLSLVGLALLWEMRLGERAAAGDNAASASVVPLPAPNQSWATAR